MKTFKFNDFNQTAAEINRRVALLAILCAAQYIRACRKEGEEQMRLLARMDRLYAGFGSDAPAPFPRFARIFDAVVDRAEAKVA